MRTYQWGELSIGSDLELPELVRAAGRRSESPDWRVRLADGRAPRRPDGGWFHQWQDTTGRRWLFFGRSPGGILLRFPRLADFTVRPAAHEICCYRPATTPRRTLRHLLLDQVLPLVAAGRDRLALHASVVAIDTGAVAFLGPAGHGKSTLAATLAHRGCALVSDDCCLLRRHANGFEVVPSYPGVRLAPQSLTHLFGVVDPDLQRVSHYSAKRRVAGADAGVTFCDRPVPLRQLYTLAPLADLARATAVTIRACSARDSLFDIFTFGFHLDVEHAPRVREAFNLAADVAETYGVRLLTFPWDLAGTDAVADAILADLTP